MAYISNTDTDRQEMLNAIGVDTFNELLAPIPPAIRWSGDLPVPPALDEHSLYRHLSSLASRNANAEQMLCFLGAGIYDHFRPAVVGALSSRGEFATAYTPYQPEMSQGMLQAIYEFQTMICGLTGMDLSNASMYDAATGLAEAALMAVHTTARDEVVVLNNIHPNYREVVKTYLRSASLKYVEVSPEEAVQSLNANTACVLTQSPDFFGCIQPLSDISTAVHAVGGLLVVESDPVALAMLKPPSQYDADVVVGEGQSLGNAMAFGGPLLGFFACKKKFVRSFPGRIVGGTVDLEGRRGYTMTLRTREQDIRREKATSNICTNQSLLALAATIYLSALGKNGLHRAADLSLQKAHYACSELCKLKGVSMIFPDRPFFKEFALRLPVNADVMNQQLLKHGIIGGLSLESYGPDLAYGWLLCVTETKTREDIDALVRAVDDILVKETC